VSAKITAMDAVAQNLGVDSSDLADKSKPKKKDKREREQTEEREKEKKVKREDERKREEDLRLNPQGAIPVPPLIPKDQALESTDALKHAALQAHQLELKKKLDEGEEPVTLSQQEDISIKGQSARQLVMQKLMKSRNASVVLLLRNMVGPEDVDEDLQRDIEEECAKYGKVVQVIIYQERQSEAADAEINVKVFVEFETYEEVKKGKEALNGRFFSGRKIHASVYDQELYDQQDLSG